MNTRLTKHVVAALILLSIGTSAFAHRLDEYLQATIISVENDHMHASMRLVPGVAVSSVILASIDTNGDGVISEAEQRTYAVQVLRDLSITVDGKRASPTLVSLKFPAIEEIKEGLGEIQIEFTVGVPRGERERTIIFENHHQNEISAYLVNCRFRATQILGSSRRIETRPSRSTNWITRRLVVAQRLRLWLGRQPFADGRADERGRLRRHIPSRHAAHRRRHRPHAVSCWRCFCRRH